MTPTREVVADASQVLFFNAAEPYRVRHPVEGGDECTVIEAAPRCLADVASAHDPAAADRPHQRFSATHCPAEPTTYFAHRLLVRFVRRHGARDCLAVDETGLALDLGYASHSHLTDAFRREFGAVPSEIRREATPARLRERRKNLEAEPATPR